MALASWNLGVRETAIAALARSSASQPLEHLLKIDDLSEQMNNSDLFEAAITQLGSVVRVMSRHPNLAPSAGTIESAGQGPD